MRGGLGNEHGVAPLERLACSDWAHVRPPGLGTALFRSTRSASTSYRCVTFAVGSSIGGGPALVDSGRVLGCVESGRSSSPGGARVAMRVGEVSAVGTGQDLATSEIVQECIETEWHGVEGR